MLKKLNQDYNLQTTEIISVLTLITLTYCLFYRIGYLYKLEIEWYLPLLSTQQILVKSLPVLLSTLIAFVIGNYIYSLLLKFPKDKKNKYYVRILLFIMLTLLASIYFESSIISFFAGNIMAVLGSRNALYYRKIFKKLDEEAGKDLNIKDEIIIILDIGKNIVFALILLPTLLGWTQARNIINNQDKTLTKVELRTEDRDWYLIEASNDKALVMEKIVKTEGNYKFKIVELKDIELLTTR